MGQAPSVIAHIRSPLFFSACAGLCKADATTFSMAQQEPMKILRKSYGSASAPCHCAPFSPFEAQRSGFKWERTSSEMNELSSLDGSERYIACEDERGLFGSLPVSLRKTNVSRPAWRTDQFDWFPAGTSHAAFAAREPFSLKSSGEVNSPCGISGCAGN